MLTVFIISSVYSKIIEEFPAGGGGYVVATKLFDYGAFTTRKQVRRVAVEAEITGLGAADLHIFLQNEGAAEEEAGAVVPFGVTWVNAAATPVTWVNSVGDPVTWIAAGRIIVEGAAGFSGNLLGAKLKGTDSVPLTIGALAEEIGILGEWTFG